LGTAGDLATVRVLAPAFPPAEEVLLQRKYRELIRNHLDDALGKLFADFTGLHFHVTWSPSPSHEWNTQAMPTGCSVCCKLSGSPLLKECRFCGPSQLARALGANGEGHYFTCRLGVRNYWFPLHVRGETLGIAYVQALDQPASGKPPAVNRSARVLRHHFHNGDATVMERPAFDRAARLLQFIVQFVQSSSLSELSEADLTGAQKIITALEREQAHWPNGRRPHLPDTSQLPRLAGAESHAEQVVHRLLERLESDYGKPVTLLKYARELGLNQNYLSGIFSRTVGVPFKTYLTALRLSKAKGLLSDPAWTASEVAYAVGYASENRFRSAFKEATGLCPRIWRQTMQAGPLPPAT